MRRRIIITGIILALVLLLAVPLSPGWAATEGTVTCTVSAQVVSISISNGSVSYGVLAVNSTKDTLTTPVDSLPKVTNDGTVTADFNIKTSNAIGGTQWTLASARGPDQFTHLYSTDRGSNWTPFTTANNYQSLAMDIDPGSSRTFDLKIGIPTTVTDGSEKTITLTVQAVAAN